LAALEKKKEKMEKGLPYITVTFEKKKKMRNWDSPPALCSGFSFSLEGKKGE